MHRFHLPPGECREDIVTLAGREAHHGLHVLRLERGARVSVLDGVGHEYKCEVCEVSRQDIRLVIVERKLIPRKPWQITLLQAIPKGKLFEDVVQKATELGAARIVPLLSERVVSHLDADGARGKAEKWRLTAIEAIKQCGSAWLPQVEVPVTPKDFLARGEKFDLPLIASLHDEPHHAREWFSAFALKHGRPPQSVCVWIGPEGDFTKDEVDAVKSAGASPISLGDLVLRTDTAAIYCLSILNHELQAAFG